MVAVSTAFKSQRAPCGRMVDGESYQDQDDQGLVFRDLYYACGCRSVRHEYHDGSILCKVVHHDGTCMVDELIAEWPA
jgi:hypothetical protein